MLSSSTTVTSTKDVLSTSTKDVLSTSTKDVLSTSKKEEQKTEDRNLTINKRDIDNTDINIIECNNTENNNNHQRSASALLDSETTNASNTDLVNSNGNQSEYTEEHSDSTFNEDISENTIIDPSLRYTMFNNVYPHLVCTSFTAEDEDLTKEEVENLTLKMEDIETIMALNVHSNERDNSPLKKINCNENISNFTSQYEQMQLLDILQNIHDRIRRKIELCSNSTKKRHYQRLIKLYDQCIMMTVNGHKIHQLLAKLPLIKTFLLEDDLHGHKCCCCDSLFHSKRALEMHFKLCVNNEWISLMKL